MKSLLILSLCAALAGCSTGVVPMGSQTYSVSFGGKPGLRSGQGERAQCYRAAHAYCADRGLVMVPVEETVSPAIFGGRTASASLTFKALRAGDPEIKRTRLVRQTEYGPPGPAPGAVMLHNMGAEMQRAQAESRARYEATRPRTYQVEPEGYGRYRVTPQAY